MILWASELRAELSQGDLISETPLGAAVAADKYLRRGNTQAGGFAPWLETPEWKPDNDGRGHFLAIGRRPKLLVLSHDCEIDKKATLPVLVAPAYPLAQLNPEHRETARKGERYAFVPLADLDSYVDLRSTAYVPRKVLAAATRERSMTDDGVEDLRLRLVAFFTRIDLAELAGEEP